MRTACVQHWHRLSRHQSSGHPRKSLESVSRYCDLHLPCGLLWLLPMDDPGLRDSILAGESANEYQFRALPRVILGLAKPHHFRADVRVGAGSLLQYVSTHRRLVVVHRRPATLWIKVVLGNSIHARRPDLDVYVRSVVGP